MESGLATSIAGFDPAAYEGDLDEDMKEAGKTTYVSLEGGGGRVDKRRFSCHREATFFKRCSSELFLAYFSSYYTFLLN